MKLKHLVTILLVFFVLGGQCHIHDGEGQFHGAKATSQRRTVQRTPLFNNIAKELAGMIRDVFNKTHLKNVTKGYVIENEIVVEDTTADNKDATNHFPLIARHYYEYETDLRLTRDRATFSVDGKKLKGHDTKALQWSNTIKEIRKMLFNLINEAIEMVKSMPKKRHTKAERQRQQEKVNQHQRNIIKLMQNIKNKVKQIISQKEYVDQDAKKAFLSQTHNANRLAEMEAVEEHILLALRRIPQRFRRWAIEAANFYIKKLRSLNDC